MKSILEFKNVNSTLNSSDGPVYVLNNISFKINKGEMIGLVGESGSGKTQLSMAATGMQDLTPGILSGSVLINRNDNVISVYPKQTEGFHEIFQDSKNNYIRTNQNAFSREVNNNTSILKRDFFGWIPQDPKNYLNPFWKIKRLFKESYNLRIESDKNFTFSNLESFLKYYLDEVDLNSDDVMNKFPHELSGGEAQRVMIAFVLSKNPKFVIADESTTGLDVSRQKKVINLFKKIKDHNPDLTMILISHDFGFLHHLVDKYMVMLGGFLIETIRDKNQMKNLENLHPYTSELLSKLRGDDSEVKNSRTRYTTYLKEQMQYWNSESKKNIDKTKKSIYQHHSDMFKEKLHNYNEGDE